MANVCRTLVATALVGVLPALFAPPGTRGAEAIERKRPASKKTASAAADDLDQLVRKLGDRSYAVRESATEALIGAGLEGRPYLTAALESDDAEVRLRAQHILSVILQDDFNRRLQEFADDVGGKQQRTMPGWSKFSETIGSDAEARELFVQMQRSEPILLEAYEQGPKHAAEALKERTDRITERMKMQMVGHSPFDAGTVAALLFVAADERVSLEESSIARLISLPGQVGFSQNVNGTRVLSEPRKRLLGRWILRTVPANYVVQNLWLGMQYELNETLIPAKQILKADTLAAASRYPALLAVGMLGNKQHLPLVERFLDDDSVCRIFGVNNQRITTQLRDVALAVAIRLHGKDPKDFGYERLQPHPRQLYNLHTLGFRSDEERQAAFQKWKQAAGPDASEGG